MANKPRYPTFVLKVNINCCKACPRKLKKWMEKIPGVISVGINPEKRLVYVTGDIDPKELIEKIHKKSNKKATLVQESNPNQDKKNHADNEKHNQRDGGRRANNSDNSSDDSDCDENSCCSEDTRDCRGHKAEAYVPSASDMINEEICRDKFCLIHPRKSIIRNGLAYMQHPFSRVGPMPPFSPFPPPPPPYTMRMPPPAPSPYPGYGHSYSQLPYSWM